MVVMFCPYTGKPRHPSDIASDPEGLLIVEDIAAPILAAPNKGGRPPAPPEVQRVNVPLRLPRWLVEWIDAQPGTRADIIEGALLKAHKLRHPEVKEAAAKVLRRKPKKDKA
jgi:hypothetical protein